jgi:hypothetical protein
MQKRDAVDRAFQRSPLGGAELRLQFPRAILEAVTRAR